MSTTSRPLCSCGQQTLDGLQLCRRCHRRLEQHLAEIPALVDELDTTRYGQARTGGQPIGGGHSSERRLPYDDRPAEAAQALLVVLRRWAGLVVDERRVGWPRETLRDYARFLQRHLDWLSAHEHASDVADTIGQAVRRVYGSIDRRAEKVYAGPCGAVEYDEHDQPVEGAPPCPADLYARIGSAKVTCEACLAVHDVTERRTWMLDAAQDALVTATELSRFFTLYGDYVTPDRIFKWADRGRLAVHGTRPAQGERKAAQLFRVGDARELLEELARKPSRRAG